MPRVKIHLTDEDCRLIGELRDQGLGWFEIAQRVGYWFEWTQQEYEAWCKVNGERPREPAADTQRYP